MRYSYLGYQDRTLTINLQQNKKVNVSLPPQVDQLKEVVVKGKKTDENVTSTEMSTEELDMKKVEKIPVLFGETDIMKTMSLRPGISQAGEGNTALHVRGGGADQNLILLDGAPVYNASHLLGFFSIFNASTLKEVKMHKGGIPAKYGGRISSVLDVTMKEGNQKEYHGEGGIGLISSHLMLEGPIVKNKSSFLIAGRRSYGDLFLNLANDEQLSNSKLYFYDLNLKANYELSDNDRLFLSGYIGRDVFGYDEIFGFDWGNITTTLRWNHVFNDQLFMNTLFLFSNYDYSFEVGLGDETFSLNSGIRDYQLKANWQWFPHIDHNVEFGINNIFHRFSPPTIESSIDFFNEFEIQDRYAIESGAYIQNKHDIAKNWKAQYGLRGSMFNLIGPYQQYEFDSSRERIIDTSSIKKGEIFETYGGLEPRFSLRYTVDEQSSIKLSYNRMHQYIHLLSNSSASSPTDLWIPSSTVVEPQIGDQVALGYFRNFNNDMFETSLEVYYKYLQNQIDYKNGANLTLNPTVETELLFGNGWSYGAELFVKKKMGQFTGWISYTLSRTMQQVDQLNEGDPYPVRHDRTHDLSIVASYQLNDNWSFSSTWVYATGNAVTFPVGKYNYQGRTVQFYTNRNGYRMPPYHRLDLSATYQGDTSGFIHSSWNFSIYNVYARKNPYLIQFEQRPNHPNQTRAVKLSLFSIVPSISWKFKF